MDEFLDSEGYPTAESLELIEKWPHKDFFNLVDTIQEMWYFQNWGFHTEWIKDEVHGYLVLKISLSTGGWSGNESIIQALKSNMFWMLSFYSHHRGGHYVFYLNPRTCGYRIVKDYCKEKSITRQAVYKSKDKYDWIEASHKRKFVRLKEKDSKNLHV